MDVAHQRHLTGHRGMTLLRLRQSCALVAHMPTEPPREIRDVVFNANNLKLTTQTGSSCLDKGPALNMFAPLPDG